MATTILGAYVGAGFFFVFFLHHLILHAASSCVLIGVASASPILQPRGTAPVHRSIWCAMLGSSQSPQNQLLQISCHPLILLLLFGRDRTAQLVTYYIVSIPSLFSPFVALS